MPPFFSVVIPSYNRADLIGKTITSVLDQTFDDWEMIIVDDGSTDHTDEVVRQFADTRISFYKKENSERGATRNYGIRKATGTYITFIDSDDIMYPHALQNAWENLNRLEMPCCFAQAFEVKDIDTGKQLQKPFSATGDTINTAIPKGNFLGCIGVFVKAEALQSLSFEEDRMFAGTEDWLLWLQLSARFPFYYSDRVCACMIEHGKRSVLGFSEEKLVYRTLHLRDSLSKDQAFVEHYGLAVISRIYAHMLTYTALHLAMSGKKKAALKYLAKGAMQDYGELLTRRTAGIIKTLMKRN